MIFEKGTVANIYRNDILLGGVKVDVYSPPLHTLENRWNIGITIDFEAFVALTVPLQIFDVIEYNSNKYKINSIIEYSTFYFVRGMKLES